MTIYYADISELHDLAGLELLRPIRRNRLDRYFRVPDKQRSLTAGLLLRTVLGEDAYLEVETAENGKPYHPGGIEFNISHSGSYVVLAQDSAPLGVDIEEVRPFFQGVAERCFTEDELAWLSRLRTPEQGFYVLWTAKESIMKATGEGFRMPPETFTVLPVASGAHAVRGRTWYLYWRELNGHMICTACQREQGSVRLEELKREDLLRTSVRPLADDAARFGV